MNRINLPVIIIFLASLCLTACGAQKAYPGPTRSSDELATLRAHGARMESVNGIAVGLNAPSVSVLAGDVEIELSIDAGNFNSRIDKQTYQISMTAEAGKEYTITGRRGDGRLCAFEVNPSGRTDFAKSAGCIKRIN